jgi:hypothetical protein
MRRVSFLAAPGRAGGFESTGMSASRFVSFRVGREGILSTSNGSLLELTGASGVVATLLAALTTDNHKVLFIDSINVSLSSTQAYPHEPC